MYISAKYRIHNPAFQIRSLYAADGPIIFDVQQRVAALAIKQGNDFFGQLLRTNIISLKLYPRALAIRD